jgi:hypothetical protein
MLVLFAKSPVSRKLTLLAGVAGIVVALGAFVAGPNVAPETRNQLIDRFHTFQNGETDTSADERLATYSALFATLAKHPFGVGFGAEGSTATINEKRDGLTLDSGIVESVLTFGIPVCSAYFAALGALVVAAARASRCMVGRMSAYFALICGLIAMLPFINALNGETSVISWAALGLLLCAGEQRWRLASQYEHPRTQPAVVAHTRGSRQSNGASYGSRLPLDPR